MLFCGARRTGRALCTRSGNTASSLIHCAMSTSLFTAGPPLDSGGSSIPLPAAADGRRDRSHLKLLHARAKLARHDECRLVCVGGTQLRVDAAARLSTSTTGKCLSAAGQQTGDIADRVQPTRVRDRRSQPFSCFSCVIARNARLPGLPMAWGWRDNRKAMSTDRDWSPRTRRSAKPLRRRRRPRYG
jgi:hypothetical protein